MRLKLVGLMTIMSLLMTLVLPNIFGIKLHCALDESNETNLEQNLSLPSISSFNNSIENNDLSDLDDCKCSTASFGCCHFSIFLVKANSVHQVVQSIELQYNRFVLHIFSSPTIDGPFQPPRV